MCLVEHLLSCFVFVRSSGLVANDAQPVVVPVEGTELVPARPKQVAITLTLLHISICCTRCVSVFTFVSTLPTHTYILFVQPPFLLVQGARLNKEQFAVLAGHGGVETEPYGSTKGGMNVRTIVCSFFHLSLSFLLLNDVFDLSFLLSPFD